MKQDFLEKAKSGETMKQWVSRNGGQVLSETNTFERIRFIANGATCVVYEGKRGISYSSHEAKALYWKFASGSDEQLGAKTKYRKTPSVMLNSILERDGNHCFYCAVEFSTALKPTIEHLVARAHKGPDHISNKFAACFQCNALAGHLSAPEKIILRDKKRGAP